MSLWAAVPTAVATTTTATPSSGAVTGVSCRLSWLSRRSYTYLEKAFKGEVSPSEFSLTFGDVALNY